MTNFRTLLQHHTALRLRRDRGAATLLVVMVLFFIVSMVAAYTSRNLIFEQKTSANQLRSTLAFEAADAGLQWAIGLLNSGRIDTDCEPTSSVSSTTFRQRYLTVNGETGAVTPANTLMPSCVFDGSNWTCSCPIAGLSTLTPPTSNGIYPAFRVRFQTYVPSATSSTVTGIVKIEVNGCTRYADSCLNFPAVGEDNEGRARVSALVMLKGGVTTSPAAALTARGSVNLGGAALNVINNSASTGITIQAGGPIDTTNMVLVSAPGTPPAGSIVQNDASLSALDAARMFSNTFGMNKSTFHFQPGAVQLACPCTAAMLRSAIMSNPGRVLWLEGALDVDSSGDIGSPSEPVAVIVTGDVQFTGAANIYGLVYTQAASWNSAGSAQLQGAMVAEGNVVGNMVGSLAYDPDILTKVRYQTGSFVIVPASWRDIE